MKTLLAKPAVKDLQEAEKFIQKENPVAANRMIKRIFEAIEYLPKHPSMGKLGRVPDTRELVISATPFIVIYQIRRTGIFILRILHGTRKWPA